MIYFLWCASRPRSVRQQWLYPESLSCRMVFPTSLVGPRSSGSGSKLNQQFGCRKTMFLGGILLHLQKVGKWQPSVCSPVGKCLDSRCPGKFVAIRPCLHKMHQNVTQVGHMIYACHVGDDYLQIIMFLDMHYTMCWYVFPPSWWQARYCRTGW